MTKALLTQIQNFDTQLEQLYQQVAAVKLQKKETIALQKKAIAVLDKLKVSVASALELSTDLGQEFAENAISIVRDLIPEKEEMAINDAIEDAIAQTEISSPIFLEEEKSVESIEEQQTPTAKIEISKSEELYVWQPTANENVGSEFDLEKNQIQCIRLGAKNKAIAKKVTNSLRDWFAELEITVGKGDRLCSKYELKVTSKSFKQEGLSDRLVEWLSEQDFSNINSWERPEHLIPRAANLKKALSSSINEAKLVAGAKVFSPESSAEYILVSWGNMRAEVKNIWTGKMSKKYLTQLEFVS